MRISLRTFYRTLLLAVLVCGAEGVALSHYDYAVTNASNRTRVDDTHDAAFAHRDRHVDYLYADVYRLTRETVTEKDSSGVNDIASRRLDYTYAEVGNRTSVVEEFFGTSGVDADRMVDYEYDVLYRLTKETVMKNGFVDQSIEYQYDTVGNRKEMLAYGHVNGQRVSRTIVTYSYDGNDRLQTESRMDETLMVLARDKNGDVFASAKPRPPSKWPMVAMASTLLMATFAPLFVRRGTGASRRRRRRAIRNGCVAAFFVPVFAIDPQNVHAFHVEAMTAAATMAVGVPTPTITTYTYDANGNQIGKQTGSISTANRFDAEGRLVAYDPNVVPNDDWTDAVNYTYDADGIRSAKMLPGGSTTHYVTDKNQAYAQVIEEWTDPTGDGPMGDTLAVRYTYGDDLISQTRPDTGGGADITRYYHYDGQMSTRQLSDDNALSASVAVTDRYTYSAFGTTQETPYTSGTATDNNYLYTGEQYDPSTSSYYLRARYYAQNTGRFVSRDSFGGVLVDPPSLHKYSYVYNNPANNLDPSGMFTMVGVAVSAAIGASIGAIVGGVIGAVYGGLRGAIKGIAVGVLVGALVGAALGFIPVVNSLATQFLLKSISVIDKVVIGSPMLAAAWRKFIESVPPSWLEGLRFSQSYFSSTLNAARSGTILLGRFYQAGTPITAIATRLNANVLNGALGLGRVLVSNVQTIIANANAIVIRAQGALEPSFTLQHEVMFIVGSPPKKLAARPRKACGSGPCRPSLALVRAERVGDG